MQFGRLFYFLPLLLFACGQPNASADGFRLDLQAPSFREKAKALAVEDLSVGESGYVTVSAANFCRSSDSTVWLFGGTLLTEPSEYGRRWDVERSGENSVRLNYQIGTKQVDADADLVWAAMAMYYANSCEEFLDRLGMDDSSLIAISSVNGQTSVSLLAEDLAKIRPGPASVPSGSDPLKEARKQLDTARWDHQDIQREDPWLFKETTSENDGSPVFEVTNISIEKDQYDDSSFAAHLVFRCEQDVLTVQILKPDLAFFAPNYMWVTYRVGDGSDKSRRWANERYKGLGLWSSEEAIPFAQELLDKDRLLIDLRITEKESLRLTFELHKIRDYIWPLAEHCNWELHKG